MTDEKVLADRLKVRHPELTTREANENIRVAYESAVSFFLAADAEKQSTAIDNMNDCYETLLATGIQEYMDPSGAYQLPGVLLAPIRKKKE